MDTDAATVKLTDLASCGGCAAKYSAARLEELLRGFVPTEAENLLVGLAPADDAAVYRLDDERALIFTLDFFPPVVDDPADYGAIAAGNALNDVFAMGGAPLLALSIAAFPEELPDETLAAVFAAADEQVRAAGWEVVWMGVRGGMEERLVPPHGYRTAWIRARAARGKGLLQKLLLPANLLFSFWESGRHLLRLKPDVVLGLGGYVAFPGGMMASLLARPLALHEQNAIAGLANRVLAGVSDKVMVAFPDALKKAEWTGNPVRSQIATMAPPAQRYARREGPIRLLVVGGSLGAQALNEAVPKALALLSPRPVVRHQAGEKHLESLTGQYRASGVHGELVAFIDDMARAYAAADLVICRAGAVTIAELSAGGMASILVPFPHAVDDHQTANARFLADRGAAILLPQRELTADRLAALIRSLDRPKLLEMAKQAHALGKPDAARLVAARCMELAK